MAKVVMRKHLIVTFIPTSAVLFIPDAIRILTKPVDSRNTTLHVWRM